jgi:SAM-dependent methyltransferase
MEHFNFNPVKFVRELHRVLKPSGRVCITVPNRGSFQAIFALLFGRHEELAIKSYFKFEDYEVNGKKGFYGFHWREYTPRELALLFSQAGFKVKVCRTFTEFQGLGQLSIGRRMARLLSRIGSNILNQFGANVFLIATKSD